MADAKRTALVTGSGRNLGRSIALRLAKAGCDIAIHARGNKADAESAAEEARALGVRAVTCYGDIGSRADVKKMADTALGAFGHVDILVNVAAVRPFKNFLEISLDDWQWILGVCLDGVVNGIRSFVPRLLATHEATGRGGHVVNTASMGGLLTSAYLGPYAAAKHAVVGLSNVNV